MLPRWNFALALTSNAIDGSRVDLQAPLKAAAARTDEAKLNTIIETVLSSHPEERGLKRTTEQLRNHMIQARSQFVPEEQIVAECFGLALASPAFQWK